MLHVECICARMTLVVQGPGWWRLHPDACFYNGYIKGRANHALGHKYFYQKRHASFFAPIALAKVSYMPHLTSKKNGEVQSCDVLRKGREEEIEGKHTNGYKSPWEAFRSISETIHSHNMHPPRPHIMLWASLLGIQKASEPLCTCWFGKQPFKRLPNDAMMLWIFTNWSISVNTNQKWSLDDHTI